MSGAWFKTIIVQRAVDKHQCLELLVKHPSIHCSLFPNAHCASVFSVAPLKLWKCHSEHSTHKRNLLISNTSFRSISKPIPLCLFPSIFASRPDTTFLWFLSPLKAIRYLVCNRYKWLIIKIVVALLLFIMMGLFLYSMPGYLVKKMLGAWEGDGQTDGWLRGVILRSLPQSVPQRKADRLRMWSSNSSPD